jgi:uncharacterized protein
MLDYRGLSNTTGGSIAAAAHLRQSVRDILLTPIGSRVMRREYGSLIPLLLDRPLSTGLMLQLQAAAVAALHRWEPRVRVLRFAPAVDAAAAGRLDLRMDLQVIDDAGADTDARFEFAL